MTDNGLIVAWLLCYGITAAFLVRNAKGGVHIDRVEALLAVALPVSWPLFWAINAVYFWKEWKAK